MTEDELFIMQRDYGLSPGPARLLYLLINTDRVSVHQIEHEYGIAKDARVLVHRLRRLLAPHDIEIRSIRMTGYWMTDEHRRAVRSRLMATA
jgi:DNA-binding response OmpR family regulator